EYSLEQNYPNPFNPTTTISFSLPQSGFVTLAVYNILGQEVKMITDGQMEAGAHRVEWNGTDNNGTEVGSGIYFYRLISDGFSDSKKMTLIK
ncbi:MAG: FlgD immunoglobulin-like domain containing protein, partial [Candidatus Zixiibacteriota bacterium]